MLYQDPDSRSYEQVHGLESDMGDLSERPSADELTDLVREFY